VNDHMPRSLPWKANLHTTLRSPSVWRAPPWTWAALDGAVEWPNDVFPYRALQHLGEEDDSRDHEEVASEPKMLPDAKILGAHIDLGDQDPFGQLVGGAITIQSRVAIAFYDGSPIYVPDNVPERAKIECPMDPRTGNFRAWHHLLFRAQPPHDSLCSCWLDEKPEERWKRYDLHIATGRYNPRSVDGMKSHALIIETLPASSKDGINPVRRVGYADVYDQEAFSDKGGGIDVGVTLH
jgi:hypothetical protein